mmetsp:Transcript_81055/g.185581  ORF Transcript_81055/g.185581 Transcript_81055/m.185581 type:complete len:604 (-) Transcript_81055:148-1959(-)
MAKQTCEFPFAAPSVCTPSCAVAPGKSPTLVLLALLQLASGFVGRPRRSAHIRVLLAVSALLSALQPDSSLSCCGAYVAATALLAEFTDGFKVTRSRTLAVCVTSLQVFSVSLRFPDSMIGTVLRHPILLCFTLVRRLLRCLPPHSEQVGRRLADCICGAQSCTPFPPTVEHLRRHLATEQGRRWMEQCLSGGEGGQRWNGGENIVARCDVVRCSVEPLAGDTAAGCVGETARVWVNFDNDKVPLSVVVKFPPQSFLFRHKTRAVGLQAAEAGFYAALCPGARKSTAEPGSGGSARTEGHAGCSEPGCSTERALAESAESSRFVLRCPRPVAVFWDWMDDTSLLILEDMAPMRTGSQLRLVEDRLVVRRVLESYASFHADFWSDSEPRLRDQVPWLKWYGWMPTFAHPRVCPFLWRGALRAVQEDSGLRDLFCPAVCGILGKVPAILPRALEWLRARPCTVVHGDARLENMFFTDDATDFAVCDWQLVQRASPMFDVAYFVCLNAASSMLVSSEDDRELVAGYCGCLWSSAPAARSWMLHEAFLDYRVNVLLVAVMVVVSMDPSDRNLSGSGRQVEIRRTMLERVLEAMIRVDCAEICKMLEL